MLLQLLPAVVAPPRCRRCADLAGALRLAGEGVGGALGSGQAASSTVPIAVAGGKTFKAIAAGDGFTCALATDGGGWCWGDGALGALGNNNINMTWWVAGGHPCLLGGHSRSAHC